VTYDLAIWKWAGEPGDAAAVYVAARQERPHAAMAAFDPRPFEAALRRRFGRANGAPLALFVYRIGMATDPPVTWVLVDIPWSQVEHVVPALQGITTELDLALYDPRAGGLLPPRPPLRARLEREGDPPLDDPDWEAVDEALGRIRSRGPSFFILSDAGGSYVQALGNQRRLTVEFRQVAPGGDLAHFVLGQGPATEEVTVFQSSAGRFAVYRHEALSLEDARRIFSHFYETGGVPSAYALREVTGEFAPPE
jgi:hypothetical protein